MGTVVAKNHREEYNATITYDTIQRVFDDEDLYNRVSVGDKVEVMLINGYTADHELVTQNLQLDNPWPRQGPFIFKNQKGVLFALLLVDT